MTSAQDRVHRSIPSVRSVTPARTLQWLRLGWQDTMRCGMPSWSHGLAVVVAGWALAGVAHQRFWLLASALTGFLIVAPLLATSLYAFSRALERGESVRAALVLRVWSSWQRSRRSDPGDYWALVRFGLLLSLAGTGWVLTSAALITLLAPVPIQTPMDFVRHIVVAPQAGLFGLWLGLGGFMAAPIFASSVVTLPLLLDRRLGVRRAVLTSWRVVAFNPVPMALWALLIMAITLAGMALALLGLALTVPWLGHASWHAYRDLVDAQGLPERDWIGESA